MGSYFLKITAETVKFLSNLSVRSLNWAGRFAMSSHFFILLKNSIKLKISNGLDWEGVFCLMVFQKYTKQSNFYFPNYCYNGSIANATVSFTHTEDPAQRARQVFSQHTHSLASPHKDTVSSNTTSLSKSDFPNDSKKFINLDKTNSEFYSTEKVLRSMKKS